MLARPQMLALPQKVLAILAISCTPRLTVLYGAHPRY